MTLHNITGSERSGPHVIIRRVPQVRRRTFADQVLSAIGGMVVLIAFITFLWSAFP